MSLYEQYKRLTNESVDPKGTGVPDKTVENRARNRLKSTEEVIAEIEERNTAEKHTWQLRQELLSRAGSEDD